MEMAIATIVLWGRALVVNILAASMLWHRTIVMEPPEELNFLGEKKNAAALYLPILEGGQGLVDVRSRIQAFRMHEITGSKPVRTSTFL